MRVSQVVMYRDGERKMDFNDPSDAFDYMSCSMKLPRNFTLRKEPYWAYSWEHLPIRFGWKGNFYSFEVEEVEK